MSDEVGEDAGEKDGNDEKVAVLGLRFEPIKSGYSGARSDDDFSDDQNEIAERINRLYLIASRKRKGLNHPQSYCQ